MAIADGLVQEGKYSKDQILISETYPPRRDYLLENGWELVESSKLVQECELAFLAVKPHHVPGVLEAFLNRIHGERATIVSVAAGVTLQALHAYNKQFTYVRVMPNTPCLVGCGASAVSSSYDELAEKVRDIMFAVGIAVTVPESQIDAVNCISGSGPAYAYVFIETLADAGVMKGLSRETAKALAIQTVLGAAEMVKQTQVHPAQLRNNVESPGGTTIAAVRALEGTGFRDAVYSAVEACHERLKEMAKAPFLS
uniref:Pyrroline-5-carboxylate reductase n=1 Tax=Rhodosorus marinus TaxID=101924 RepID=A0A7S0G3J3_9RHOD